MTFSAATKTSGRPGKTFFRSGSRAAGKQGASAPDPASPSPTPAAGTLDHVRAAVWEAFRHLFPPHALAAQTPGGSVVISWSITDEPEARFPYAAPVMLRLDEALVEAMWRADAGQRIRIAQNHEATLREGLRGYDPFTRFPNARVVSLG